MLIESRNGLLADAFAPPAIIADAGEHAVMRYIEFFTARVRNPNTRSAYMSAINQFLTWCHTKGLELSTLRPVVVGTYIEWLSQTKSIPTVKQHLAAIRMLFDDLVMGQICPANPCHGVRGPRHVVRKGKTPVLTPAQARQLLNSITMDSLIGLRDRALIATMVYSFARVSSAVVGMSVEDYWQNGKRWWLRLHEKGGRHHEVPVHHTAEEYLDAYVAAAGIAGMKKSPLFRSVSAHAAVVSESGLGRRDALAMIKRRAITASSRFAPPASLRISQTAARWKMPRTSPHTHPHERRCSMTDAAMKSASMRLNAS